MQFLLASGNNPVSHVLDAPVRIGGMEPYSGLTLQVVTLFVGLIAFVAVLLYASKNISTGKESLGHRRYLSRGRIAQVIEVMCLYLRDDMLTPMMGKKDAHKFAPFLLTLFFLILSLNLIGMVPMQDLQLITGTWIEDAQLAVVGGTATANIAVNAVLAFFVFIVIQAHGFRELGVKGWLEHLCGGHELVHGSIFLWLVVPIIFVVEFFGLFVKPAALAIRLFANMVAGHTLLITLTMFGAMAIKAGLGTFAVGGITIVSGVGAILITFLEVFVAVLQAFIFMFLTAVFISLMAHEEEEGHSEHGTDDGHAASVTTAAH